MHITQYQHSVGRIFLIVEFGKKINHVLNIFVLFKSLNTVISVDELPHTVNLFNMNIILIFFHLDTRDVTLADGLP